MRKPFILSMLLLSTLFLSAQVKLYRQLPEIPVSEKFKVEIRQENNPFQQVFTYGIPVTERVLVTKTEHIAMFAFEPKSGPVEVKISSQSGENLDANSIELVNKTVPNVSISCKDGSMFIKLSESKKQLFVRLKNDPGNPLNIFADPIQESPISATANVFRFEARKTPYVQTAQYDRFTVSNDVDVVYIEDGALIKGTIHTAKDRTKPLKIMGQGMVIGNGGILNGAANIPYNAIVATKGIGNSIEGITVMKSRHFSMDIGENGHIDNVKLFGYAYNNDGIVAGKNSMVENSFLKVNDDHIKLYNDSIIVRNCIFYVQTNGGVIQFAWNRIDPGDYCLVENCEVVACEYENCGDPETGQGGLAHCFISLREAEEDGKVLKNTVIKDILIQGQLQRFLGINGFSFKGVTVEGLTLENINVLNAPLKQSWVYTKDGNQADIQFRNVMFGKRKAEASDFKTSGEVKLEFKEKRNVFKYQNPISSGIDTNGVRDCQVLRDGDLWYMTATSYPHWSRQETNGNLNKGVVLYQSDDLLNWKFVNYVVKRPDIGNWYYNRFWAPEIHKIGGKYYASFNCRNDSLGYVGQYGGYAVADQITGPYKVVTDEKPLMGGNDLTFFEDTDGKVWAFWNRGRDFGIGFAQIDLATGKFLTEPQSAIKPGKVDYEIDSNGEVVKVPGYDGQLIPKVAKYYSWDAIGIEGAYVIKHENVYYLFYSSWTRGYEIGYATAPAVNGPWTKHDDEPFYGAQSKAACKKNGFEWKGDPNNPFDQVGHNEIFTGPDGRLWISCHGIIPGKAPMLVIDPIWFEKDETVKSNGPTYTKQVVPIKN